MIGDQRQAATLRIGDDRIVLRVEQQRPRLDVGLARRHQLAVCDLNQHRAACVRLIQSVRANIVDYYKGAAAQKEITLSSSLPAEPFPLIEGNEAMLQRALNILIDNAICYTPAGGHIAVEVSLQAKKVTIAVRDDGPGIAPEHQARIFDRFYRVDKNRTDRAHSGLGLSIAKKVIDDHGGELTYKTASPHGYILSITLSCFCVQYTWQR